jgi:hypothetical protein
MPMALTHASVDLPFTFETSAWLLPAAVIATRTAADTSGATMADADIGLGDVSEFGVSTLVDIAAGDAPFVFATFKLGVAEDRVFRGQPALALAFRKSLEHVHDGVETQLAQLSLTASKHLGERVAVHASGAMWDVRVEAKSMDAEKRVAQLAASAGVEVAVQKRVGLMIDAGFARDSDTRLTPTISLSGRYLARPSLALESAYVTNGPETRLVAGVSVQVYALRRAVDALGE